ncbi:vancomycin resistance protein VanW [Sporobacter termitidis DSM 10068]|uniref:Vancomycin resistance protein VanW n=1 Tax=Sporobacter termitidis DSM 10068 TaxID=1123282 RepID=A0A1M5Z8T5_9FIRM|nr:VanW family protein [Sporobacter termitidis]SHI20622.1 vancomycin resistance protein VanW [Sporobacter termitidis DSM 10068]
MVTKPVSEPIRRSSLRYKAAVIYHSARRYAVWLARRRQFAGEIEKSLLPCVCFHHETLLLRQLKDVDMRLQRNKITNLRLAAAKLDGVVVHPGETFSYWKLIGKPTYKKGYLDGVILNYGRVMPGCGGGLCQLSNLIYWMTLHTPLVVTERHRHGYDVFPDSGRTQPFGSGATCFYPYGDLMVRNETPYDFQLSVHVGPENLVGEWRSEQPPEYQYEVVEKNHSFSSEYWGGFSRHNQLYRRTYDLAGHFIREDFITENHALMMYPPFIDAPTG